MKSTANLLGALTMALTDRIRGSTQKLLERAGESPAAIVVIGYVPGISVELLRQVLGLSHPGTVRLIDRLSDDGYVERQKAKDGRAVALHLTTAGTDLRANLMDSRIEILENAVESLSSNEQEMLGHLLSKVLSTLPETEMDKHHICRLCSTTACPDCPIRGNAI
ncbi:MarR family winged helix-turn-helix transcriptional regulator [Alteromonas oceanisediminis]|uniref:MarR family winged helix-turn-helix transcriptional regulator n=1 Tax=Alteromonas oceanisediminis TaxID=2836180 RepID=UPI001BDA45D6|nr:MarR family winged helix-turn-helix transcriptional regulator [Alteromonas oceanisediminis]MBT0586149.1 MarR family winged helix-turn-helix transcriptional regulator [Alteromonas oceanisediminis]